MTKEKKLSMALMLVRKRNPFLGTLALQIEHRIDEEIPTACTDGSTVWYGRKFIDACSLSELGGVVLHEILHASLLHNVRRKNRNPRLWNIAADIVVNGMVLQESWARLPFEPVINRKLESLRVEDVYSVLLAEKSEEDLLVDEWMDVMDSPSGGNTGDADRDVDLEAHWKQAWRQAQIVQHMTGTRLGTNLKRLLDELTVPQVDWRTRLWQYLVRTPADFGAWDRRFIHKGLYLENLEGEDLKVGVCVDTSGSITPGILEHFIAELESVLNSYPNVKAFLYFADAQLYGPHEVRKGHDIPEAKGGGGTSFVPFFEEIKNCNQDDDSVLIYLTDGYGVFPDQEPCNDILWVVPSHGLASQSFPFGEVVRIEAA